MTATAQLMIASCLICVEIVAVVFSIIYVPPTPMFYYPSVTRVKLVCHTDWTGMMIPFGFVLLLITVCTYYAVITRYKYNQSANATKAIKQLHWPFTCKFETVNALRLGCLSSCFTIEIRINDPLTLQITHNIIIVRNLHFITEIIVYYQSSKLLT